MWAWFIPLETFYTADKADSIKRRGFLATVSSQHVPHALSYLILSGNAKHTSWQKRCAILSLNSGLESLISDFAAEAANVEFVSGVRGTAVVTLPPRLQNRGYMSRSEFYDELAQSLVLVGIGFPFTSPSPYDALCFGVPFVNPIHDWDAADPLNRNKWTVQHDMIKHLDPPYVYHVYKGDRDGFVKAIEDAVAHPIERFVLDHMRMEAVEQRLRNILNADWEIEFLALERSLAAPSSHNRTLI
ncbi:hypothetical protein MVEN_00761900 [Mycena venus]|uniref:Glycosyltransferase family 18 catalytic domain-containing protein n=1 Tax=Mycena venus TaxID=2733690 RepID=A0A8H7D336_9AGAR|nr:hypothetical protein MVEN_00761900 [Mycena venus]